MVQIQQCQGEFGMATVLDLDPASDGAATSELRNALAHAGVVCLRFDRPLEDEELQSVSRLFGPIKDPVARAKDGKAFRYSEPRQIIDSGFVMTDEIRAKLGAAVLAIALGRAQLCGRGFERRASMSRRPRVSSRPVVGSGVSTT